MAKSWDRSGGARGARRDDNYGGGGHSDDNRGNRSSGGGDDRQARAPLQWNEIKAFSRGEVKASITAAKRQDGSEMYSLTFERAGRDRPSRFFRPDTDIDAIKSLCDDVQAWWKSDGS